MKDTWRNHQRSVQLPVLTMAGTRGSFFVGNEAPSGATGRSFRVRRGQGGAVSSHVLSRIGEGSGPVNIGLQQPEVFYRGYDESAQESCATTEDGVQSLGGASKESVVSSVRAHAEPRGLLRRRKKVSGKRKLLHLEPYKQALEELMDGGLAAKKDLNANDDDSSTAEVAEVPKPEEPSPPSLQPRPPAGPAPESAGAPRRTRPMPQVVRKATALLSQAAGNLQNPNTFPTSGGSNSGGLAGISGPIGKPVIAPEFPSERKGARPAGAVEPVVPSFVSPAAVAAVFRKLMDDGMIHHDEISRGLELLGFVPMQVWVDEVFAQVTKFSTLSLEQFAYFVNEYEVHQLKAYTEAFVEADTDGSGSVEAEELEALLRSFRIEPMKHVLEGVIAEVDEDGTGSLNLEEFIRVMNIIKGREGFSNSDYKTFMKAFRKFDRDNSGEIDSNELFGVMCNLGYTTDPELLGRVMKEVDADGGGTLNEREFLICMRKFRDIELEKVKAVMKEHDADGSGTIGMDELRSLLTKIGYFPSGDAVVDAAAEAGLDPTDDDLDLCKLWRLLQVYRSREGLSWTEIQDVRETFAQFASDDGTLGISSREMAMRWMGFPYKFEIGQILTHHVDIDCSGKLDEDEFKLLIRMCRDREIQRIKDAFMLHDENGKGMLTDDEAIDAFKSIDCVNARGEPPLGLAKDPRDPLALIEIQRFVETALWQKQVKRRFFRERCGFSPEEVMVLKSAFREMDADASGTLEKAEMVSLLESIFPEMSQNIQLRARLIGIIHEINEDGTGSLSFDDFLRLLRRSNDLQNSERFEKERKAVDLTGFSSHEVYEFRKLFLDCDLNNDEELSLAEFKGMIAKICPMGDRNSTALTTLFYTTTQRQEKVEGRRECADFPEFLLLLAQLLDTNFGSIKERTGSTSPPAVPKTIR